MNGMPRTGDSWNDLTSQEKVDFKDAFHENIESTVEIQTTELFAGGMCARTGTIPAGVVFIGRAHRQEQIQILSSGVIEIFGDNCNQMIHAPHVFKGEVGEKRLVKVLEAAVWTTVLKTDATCIEDVIAECTTLTLAELKTQVGKDVCDSSSDGSNCNIQREPQTRRSEKGP